MYASVYLTVDSLKNGDCRVGGGGGEGSLSLPDLTNVLCTKVTFVSVFKQFLCGKKTRNLPHFKI